MTLTNLLKNTKNKIANLALATVITTTLPACSNPNNPTPPNPTPTTQTIKVLSSDGRSLGTATYNGNANEPLTIRLVELASKGITGLNTVDANYATLRKDNTADNKIGTYVANTIPQTGPPTGSLSYTPTQTETLVLWTMNNTNNADYTCAANTSGFVSQGFRNNQRYATVQRLTPTNNTVAVFNVVEGDTTNIQQGLELLNQALRVNNTQYSSLTWIGDSNGDIKGGLGTHQTLPASGVHIGNSYIVSQNILASIEQKNISAMEAIVTHFMYDDLCGQDSTKTLLGNTQASDLTPKGKDYVRFASLMKNQ